MVRRGDTDDEPGRADDDARRSALPGIAAFGVFRLRATERVLEKDGVPLKIGSRALDILVMLADRAPEVVSNRDLMARVWGSLVVGEGSLRFHIAALRKTLGADEAGTRYVTNIPGRARRRSVTDGASRGDCRAMPVTSKPAGPSGSGATPIASPRLASRPRT